MSGPHDISPLLEKQLVLELEAWKLLAERVEVFPGGRLRRFAAPVDEQLANAARQASPLNPSRLWSYHAMVDVWQCRWSRRRHAAELLEGAHMEHVVDASLWRKVQTYSHVVDELGDAIGPDVAWLQLACSSLG